MSGANYEWCPVCGKKALYVGEDDTSEVIVLHADCWQVVAAGEWRDYTIEPFAGALAGRAPVVCRSDGACEWTHEHEGGYYLTLGEAVDRAKEHAVMHRQDPETLP